MGTNKRNEFVVAIKERSVKTEKISPGAILGAGFLNKEAAEKKMPGIIDKFNFPSKVVGIFHKEKLVS